MADFYARDGFLLKAIAIWKKINKLDPTTLDPYLNLADLYAKQGLMMEAKGQYQVVVDEYVKRGRTREAGDVLKKVAEIDPGVRPSMRLASTPTAWTSPVRWSIATTDGSDRTMPRPRT